jgi:hypothetical protein
VSPVLLSSDSIEVVAASGSKRFISGAFHSYASRHLILTTDERLPIDIVVSVQHEDVLFAGEVVSCRPEAEHFRITIHVEHTLTSLQSLLNLRDHLLESRPEAIKPTDSAARVLQSASEIESAA